ncbi:hypothetical protein MTR67_052946 [Solanum verrucosum]|uniref:Viral late gene transcription factor 3 zinc ribbon domain-containing protein n=1 Tax=Solanum verrucosum TaxID=315347 RepID=A0AAF0VA31_SOLVR|nr:uncharacterized protein LOC125809732 isoform X1 [Solanum verrucosum]WMV59561.1 hypothetical protein MTR67_052946 [Solanum verrucosum]
MATPLAPLHGFNSPAIPLNKQPQFPLLMKRNRQFSNSINAASTDIITADPTQVEITWQIVAGSLAGVTPFVVAGVEFSKRIVKQRKCEVCGGSGLVLKNKFYKRCPNCGGFLPWQSWRRFFTG